MYRRRNPFYNSYYSTMASHIILGPMLVADINLIPVAEHRILFLADVLLEIINTLASVSIAIVLYPIIWISVQAEAVAYVISIIELFCCFGYIELGPTTDIALSLPIWINEMALALWLIVRGVEFHDKRSSAIQESNHKFFTLSINQLCYATERHAHFAR